MYIYMYISGNVFFGSYYLKGRFWWRYVYACIFMYLCIYVCVFMYMNIYMKTRLLDPTV